MSRSLSELAHEIMQGVYDDEKWLELDREVKEALSVASAKEEEEFTDSGAGEVLYMMCSGIEYFRDKRNAPE